MKVRKLIAIPLACLLFMLLFHTQAQDSQVKINKAIREVRALLQKSDEEKDSGRFDKARKLVREALSVMEQVPDMAKSRKAMNGLNSIALRAYSLGDFETTKLAWSRVLDYLEQNYHPDSPKLQQMRTALAATMISLGELSPAKALLEKAVEVYERTRSPDDALLQEARQNYGITLNKLGRPSLARQQFEKVLKAYERTPPPDESHIHAARLNLGLTLKDLGQLSEAKALFEEVLEVYERNLPPDHFNVQTARLNLATTLKELGKTREAKWLLDNVLEACERTLPPEHPLLQKTRLNIAMVKSSLGDNNAAWTMLDRVVEAYERILPPESLELQQARINLAILNKRFGDLPGARALEEKVLKVFERILPDNHLSLQQVRVNHATTQIDLKNYKEARALYLKVLEVYESILPPDHPSLRRARIGLALSLYYMEELKAAKTILEKILKECEHRLPPYHPDLQDALWSLALILSELDDWGGAFKLFEQTVQSFDPISSQKSRKLRKAQSNLGSALCLLGKPEKAATIFQDAIKGIVQFMSRRQNIGAVREIDETVEICRGMLDQYYSLGRKGAFTAKECFIAGESFRAAGARAGHIRRIISQEGGEEIRRLQEALTWANLEVASAIGEGFVDAIRVRDRAENALAGAVVSLPRAKEFVGKIDVPKIEAALPAGWACASIMKYGLLEYFEKAPWISETPSYLAFVLKPGKGIERIELGPAEPIDIAVEMWREELCRGSTGRFLPERTRRTGERVKKLVWNPICAKLDDIKKVVVAPDSLLATVPLEALPEGKGALVDKYTFSYADSLFSLAVAESTIPDENASLIAFGGIDFDAIPKRWQKEGHVNAGNPKRLSSPLWKGEVFAFLRDGKESKALPLPGTEAEAESVAAIYSGASGKEAFLVKGEKASKASLIALSPRARFLHIATHGYYAPEDVKSTLDPEPGREKGIFSTMKEKVTGLAPSLLCGLKLAGCNLPRKGMKAPGVITAEEIQGLDLCQCELAVLSACEGKVGLSRTGQGIMSMQRALGIAGARGSITSLWKVDDRATQIFFLEFYRLLWEEGKTPSEALRQAKLWLRGLTIEEVKKLLPKLSTGDTRGVKSIGRVKTDLPSTVFPYASPFYWAAFVYWGKVK